MSVNKQNKTRHQQLSRKFYELNHQNDCFVRLDLISKNVISLLATSLNTHAVSFTCLVVFSSDLYFTYTRLIFDAYDNCLFTFGLWEINIREKVCGFGDFIRTFDPFVRMLGTLTSPLWDGLIQLTVIRMSCVCEVCLQINETGVTKNIFQFHMVSSSK